MKKVLLTGISGFIGQHIAVELLKQGYAVKGSVRSLEKAKKVTEVIKENVDPQGHLEFCELNLLSDNGWKEAMQDCDFVLHVASPFVSTEPKDENELIQPAVEGTLRAVKNAKAAGIKRIVVTSSMVAMLGDMEEYNKVSDQSWTNTNSPKATAYLKSKTLAERNAWDFINNQGEGASLEMVTIHPGPVYGPSLSDNLSGESMSTFKKIIDGKLPRIPQASINMSDVRDVAKIHVLALENPKAAGKRFVVAGEKDQSFLDLTNVLKKNGYDKVSNKLVPNFLVKLLALVSNEMKGMVPYVGKTYRADVTPTKEVFDWTPIPFEKMVLDTAKFIEKVS